MGLTKCGPLEEGMATLQYSWQKDMTPEDESPRSEGVQCATGGEQRAITTSSRKTAETESKGKRCSVVNVSGAESKV